MDLSIRGGPTPRQARVSSAKGKKPSKTSGSLYDTPEAPRQGARPPAGKPPRYEGGVVTQSQVDQYKRPKSRGPKPDNVPSLDLARLADYDNTASKPILDYKEKMSTPDTASTVSWGYHDYNAKPSGRNSSLKAPFALHHTPQTPLSGQSVSCRPANVPKLNIGDKQKQKAKTAWDDPAVPENIPPPSERQKKQFKQHQTEVKQQYKQQQSQEGAGNQAKQQEPKPEPAVELAEDEPLNTNWNNASLSTRQEVNKRIAAESVAAERMKQHIMETVLVDQLSRAPISDPEQDQVSTPASSHRYYSQSPKPRNLHATKANPTNSVTEKMLAKRLSFSCRVVSRSGNMALRELCGFYFALDKTMTIYEFRQFGKKASALPFIKRDTYRRMIGRRKGLLYTAQDLTRGEDLSFETEDQPSLPECLQKKPVAVLRVTDVDEDMKKDFIFGDNVPYNDVAVRKGMHPQRARQEAEDWKLISNVQNEVHKQIKSRASRTLTGLGKHFKKLDKSGDGTLDKDELQEALKTYHIKLDKKLFDQLWLIIDQNGDGAIDYSEFCRAFIGEMNEFRKHFVIKAFKKIDANKSGTVGIDEVKKFFRAHKHPLVISGKSTEQQLLNDFLDVFGPRVKEISYGEFEDYYEGVSIATKSDDDFMNLIQGCWTL
ncbi:calcyphosin-2-like [Strongylocentrotus purpuratus]|uniref:EF-hand domain-containing protein n=1 Tax=Strongylocentrotus purpuratus TaxID=7668 RepID=A0A7M7NF82_STRPU|nr:calcyphosin-2-like [Strongylocentrotus purpuratus]